MTGRRFAIWNPASGSAPEAGELRAALDGDTELLETTPDDPGGGLAGRAVRRGADVVVACGGDGTVRACLDALADTGTALAVVPLGTGNLLAANLGLPSGLDAAGRVGAGEPRRIDLGRVNGEAFAVMAGTGFDAMMIRDASSESKSRFGSLAYVWSGARNLRSALVPTVIDVDGDRWLTARTSLVLVGNFGTITAGIEVFPDAEPDDGLLDVAVVSAATWREWLTVAWSLLRRRPAPDRLVRRTRGRRINVEQEVPRVYELDGEDRAPTTRLDISVQPRALAIHQGV